MQVSSHLPSPFQMLNVETHQANPSSPFPSSQGRLLNCSGVRRGSMCRPHIQGSAIPESGPDLPTLLSMDTRDKQKDRGTEGRVSFVSERQRGDWPKTRRPQKRRLDARGGGHLGQFSEEMCQVSGGEGVQVRPHQQTSDYN